LDGIPRILLILHVVKDTWIGTGIQPLWRTKMKTPPRLKTVPSIILCVGLFLCGCRGKQQQVSANSATQTDQPSSDPADANLAPVSNTSAAPAYQPSPAAAQDYAQQNPYSDEYAGEYSDQYTDSPDESYYGVEPVDTAPDPPPPLPEYDQPPCPGDDYVWTPGYWDYASTGYYWVPGVWVEAPYVGALWTPGYWAYSQGHYAFFRGYWGPHIGFYGGVNYGFGYVGVGYQGGYWNGGHFDVNRSVNNVNVTVVHNVYSRTIVNNTTIVNNRVSYNGGSGGIQLRPRPAELAALREPHAPPMQTQLQVQRSAGSNRAQFASVNHGRPVELADSRPVAAVRDVRPVAPTNIHNLPAAARPPLAARNNSAPEANRPQPNHPQPQYEQPNRPQQNPPQTSRQEPNLREQSRPQAQPQPMRAQPEPGRQEQYHPAPNQHPMQTAPNRSEPPQQQPAMQSSRPPETNHQPQAQYHPAPQNETPGNETPRNESRPAPPENHPAPQVNHSAPNHSAPPAHNPPPQEHKDDHPQK
jgi:hypothetical protein